MINPNDPAAKMSIRTHLAVRALQGILSYKGSTSPTICPDDPKKMAATACRYADALIAELNKEPQ